MPWVPIPRIGGKKGTKRSILVDEYGVPLSVCVSGANTHDSRLLEKTLDGIMRKRPRTNPETRQNLCLDAGYVGMKTTVLSRNYCPHIRPRGEEAKAKRKGKKPRRWVVERTLSWINRFRKVHVRFEKKAANHLGLLELVCGMIAWRQIVVIYG